jgi:hypothetical protein
MTPTIVLTETAKLKLQTLDPPEAQRVLDALTRIAEAPAAGTHRRLLGRSNTFLYPVGRLMLVIEFSEGSLTLITAYQGDELGAAFP